MQGDIMNNGKRGDITDNRSFSVSMTSYHGLLEDISVIIANGRHAVIRRINTVHVVVYWLIGRRIVEFYQQGRERAAYGEEVLKILSADLKSKYGNGFSERNLEMMRLFYIEYPISKIAAAKLKSVELISQTVSAKFRLSWSHS